MSFLSAYNLPYKNHIFFPSTNFKLGRGWSFIDLDNEEIADSYLDIFFQYTSIAQAMSAVAPFEFTIPQIMCIFYRIKKFRVTTSVPGRFSVDDPLTVQERDINIVRGGLGSDPVEIDNIYKYMCGPTGDQAPHVWLYLRTYSYSSELDNNRLIVTIEPVFYIYQNKYRMGLTYFQSYVVTGADPEDPEETIDYVGQILADPHISSNGSALRTPCGTLSFMGKKITLYNSINDNAPSISCTATITPIEYWTVDSV